MSVAFVKVGETQASAATLYLRAWSATRAKATTCSRGISSFMSVGTFPSTFPYPAFYICFIKGWGWCLLQLHSDAGRWTNESRKAGSRSFNLLQSCLQSKFYSSATFSSTSFVIVFTEQTKSGTLVCLHACVIIKRIFLLFMWTPFTKKEWNTGNFW